MVTTFTYKPSLVRIDACNFDIVVTNKHRQQRLQYTAPQLACSVIIVAIAVVAAEAAIVVPIFNAAGKL